MKERKEFEDMYINANEQHGELNLVDKAKLEVMLDIRELLKELTTYKIK